MDKNQLFLKFRGNPPVVAAEVEHAEANAGFSLPEDYVSFLRKHNGGEGFIGPNAYAILWALSELMDMNKAYEVQEFAPGLFLFGSDGGGEAYAFDRRTSTAPIVSVPFVGMDLSLVKIIAPTFDDFLNVLFKI